jgi:capsular polysaccharide transport system permease protein
LGNAANRPSLTRRALERRPERTTLGDRILAIGWRGFLRTSFVLLVALPLGVTAAYELFIASPSYVAEVRLAVRQATDRPLVDTYLGAGAFDAQPSPSAARTRDGKAKQTGSGTSSSRSQGSAIAEAVMDAIGGSSEPVEPYVITDYLSSLELVAKLDQDGWLRARFSGGNPDWFQALPADASQEELARYWQSAVSASLDTTTGLVAVTIKAFTPEDSQAIAAKVVAECDALLNRMMERARHDRMKDAKKLVAHAQERYAAAQSAMRALRSEEYQIDPQLAADASFRQLMQLISARISMDVQLRIMEPGLDASAPQLKVLKARIASLDDEIERAKAALTNTNGAPTAAANYLAEFEARETERIFSVGLYQSALDSLERVRLATERQAVYLAPFIPPLTPDYASGPDVKGSLGIVALVGTLLWGLIVIIAAASRDQAGVPR